LTDYRSEIILYRTQDGKIKIDVRMENDTVWLSQAQMAELFQTTKQNVSLHINNVFTEGELTPDSVVKEYLTTASDGKSYSIKHYNLDMILSVGYRVRSGRGTQFRIWATERLREYMVKGFAINDDLLKQAGGGSYWKELLERIRDIRSSEKVFYRQLLDLFATSVDYNPKADECKQFFGIMQNKMHYAVNQQTAAELIFTRADASKPFMGMKSFAGDQPKPEETKIAKNYLDEKELTVLNRLVSAFFDLAELHALQHEHVYMRDWLPQMDDFAKRYGQGALLSAGTVSHEAAIEKAVAEYRKYRRQIDPLPSAAEQDYLSTMKQAQKLVERETSPTKNKAGDK
jgi:hypothetical protein